MVVGNNLIKALITMFIFIDKSFEDDEVGNRIVEPFAFNKNSFLEPTFFQLIFICDRVKSDMALKFAITVISEWLFGSPGRRKFITYS